MKTLIDSLRKIYRSIRYLHNRIMLLFRFLFEPRDKTQKVFCISIQKTGTTSVGKFLRDYGYRCVGWPADEKNDWSQAWYDGDYERIFTSVDFTVANAYEDSPWFFPDFYKVLYHRFPNAKFILLTRNPDAWFKSMESQTRGNIVGKSRIHAKLYRRELEYFDLLQSGDFDEKIENTYGTDKTMKLTGLADYYKEIYRLYHTEVQDFFQRHAPDALHVGQLEDPEKWHKLGKFLGIEIPSDYDSHENASGRKS